MVFCVGRGDSFQQILNTETKSSHDREPVVELIGNECIRKMISSVHIRTGGRVDKTGDFQSS